VISSIPIGAKPYACAISADERTAYVSHWGGDSVAVIDLATARVVKNIKVQDHPNDLVLTSSGARLFVANGNRNTVSVIDTRKAEVIEQIDVALVPKSPLGSTPNALALSSDEKTLFVANADNNCLAVIDIAQGKGSVPRGFIPTGWYPTAIGVATTGKKLIVANGKGSASRENASLWNEGFDRKNPGYVGNLLEGTLSFIDMPTAKTLALYSQQVHRNSPGGRKKLSSIKAPFLLGTRSPIKHIIYIVKGNRTYDQILGDVPEGNGDPTYCLFPEEVTPNHHALARQFVLFDNLYHDAEVSADGHHWTTSAYATDMSRRVGPAPTVDAVAAVPPCCTAIRRFIPAADFCGTSAREPESPIAATASSPVSTSVVRAPKLIRRRKSAPLHLVLKAIFIRLTSALMALR